MEDEELARKKLQVLQTYVPQLRNMLEVHRNKESTTPEALKRLQDLHDMLTPEKKTPKLKVLLICETTLQRMFPSKRRRKGVLMNIKKERSEMCEEKAPQFQVPSLKQLAKKQCSNRYLVTNAASDQVPLSHSASHIGSQAQAINIDGDNFSELHSGENENMETDINYDCRKRLSSHSEDCALSPCGSPDIIILSSPNTSPQHCSDVEMSPQQCSESPDIIVDAVLKKSCFMSDTPRSPSPESLRYTLKSPKIIPLEQNFHLYKSEKFINLKAEKDRPEDDLPNARASPELIDLEEENGDSWDTSQEEEETCLQVKDEQHHESIIETLPSSVATEEICTKQEPSSVATLTAEDMVIKEELSSFATQYKLIRLTSPERTMPERPAVRNMSTRQEPFTHSTAANIGAIIGDSNKKMTEYRIPAKVIEYHHVPLLSCPMLPNFERLNEAEITTMSHTDAVNKVPKFTFEDVLPLQQDINMTTPVVDSEELLSRPVYNNSAVYNNVQTLSSKLQKEGNTSIPPRSQVPFHTHAANTNTIACDIDKQPHTLPSNQNNQASVLSDNYYASRDPRRAENRVRTEETVQSRKETDSLWGVSNKQVSTHQAATCASQTAAKPRTAITFAQYNMARPRRPLIKEIEPQPLKTAPVIIRNRKDKKQTKQDFYKGLASQMSCSADCTCAKCHNSVREKHHDKETFKENVTESSTYLEKNNCNQTSLEKSNKKSPDNGKFGSNSANVITDKSKTSPRSQERQSGTNNEKHMGNHLNLDSDHTTNTTDKTNTRSSSPRSTISLYDTVSSTPNVAAANSLTISASSSKQASEICTDNKVNEKTKAQERTTKKKQGKNEVSNREVDQLVEDAKKVWNSEILLATRAATRKRDASCLSPRVTRTNKKNNCTFYSSDDVQNLQVRTRVKNLSNSDSSEDEEEDIQAKETSNKNCAIKEDSNTSLSSGSREDETASRRSIKKVQSSKKESCTQQQSKSKNMNVGGKSQAVSKSLHARYKLRKPTQDLSDPQYYPSGKTNMVACLVCTYSGKKVVQHYLDYHPDIEVLYSRLSPEEAKEALELDETPPPMSVITCRFCLETFVEVDSLFDHVTEHTGEYRYMCPKCDDFVCQNKKLVRQHIRSNHPGEIAHDKPENLVELQDLETLRLPGYLCGFCRFVQCERLRVERHIELRHRHELGATLPPEVKEITEINLVKLQDQHRYPSFKEEPITEMDTSEAEPYGEFWLAKVKPEPTSIEEVNNLLPSLASALPSQEKQGESQT